jgi:hypothetical protein
MYGFDESDALDTMRDVFALLKGRYASLLVMQVS